MGSDNFCLRWNDFESNVSGSFKTLREEKDFLDVTLVTEEARHFQAHKVILSACSAFFKATLRKTGNHPNPFIYLRGIHEAELEAVLDFMYHGEVNVAQEELNSFLAVAEDLQIKGLTQKQTNSQNEQNSVSSPSQQRKVGVKSKLPSSTSTTSSPSSVSAASAAKKIRPDVPAVSTKDIIDVKSEPLTEPAHLGANDPDTYDETGETYDESYTEEGYYDDASMMDMPNDGSAAAATADNSKENSVSSDLDKIIETKMAYNPGTRHWSCMECSKSMKGKTDIVRHIESAHLDTGGIFCPICQVVCRTRHSLYRHTRNHHPEIQKNNNKSVK